MAHLEENRQGHGVTALEPRASPLRGAPVGQGRGYSFGGGGVCHP